MRDARRRAVLGVHHQLDGAAGAAGQVALEVRRNAEDHPDAAREQGIVRLRHRG
jgi:hypothetical protein